MLPLWSKGLPLTPPAPQGVATSAPLKLIGFRDPSCFSCLIPPLQKPCCLVPAKAQKWWKEQNSGVTQIWIPGLFLSDVWPRATFTTCFHLGLLTHKMGMTLPIRLDQGPSKKQMMPHTECFGESLINRLFVSRGWCVGQMPFPWKPHLCSSSELSRICGSCMRMPRAFRK